MEPVRGGGASGGTAVGPGKRTLVDQVQRKADEAGAGSSPATVHSAAAHGVSGSSHTLPHAGEIQRLFGRHDVSGIHAHTDAAATAGAQTMGAQAFAVGDHVAFATMPDLHTAAHEAAHVVQQRGGVQLKGGVGEAGDAHERHADRVADCVVAGRSAQGLLDEYADRSSATGGDASAVQRQVAAAPIEPVVTRDSTPTAAPSSTGPNPTGSAAPGPSGVSPPTATTTAGQLPHATSPMQAGASDADAGKGGPALPLGHEGHKLKFEIGHGSITGAITLSIELGKTGVPLPEHMKLFKSTLSAKLNGFVAKLETVVLNGNLDAEILDGVKVAVDVSVLKMSSNKLKPDDAVTALDLMTVALKLQGDVGHWIEFEPGAKVTLEGQVQLALGGKLAAQFAKYTAAQLDRMMLAKETEVVGEALAGHVQEIERIESQLTKLKANPVAARREIQLLEQELFKHRIQVSTGNQQLKGLARRLGEAKGRARAALGRIEGKFAKKIAWAMEKKAVKAVAKCLAWALPIANVLSTVADVIELIKLARDIYMHHGHVEIGGGDGESDSTTAQGAEGSAAPRSGAGHSGSGDASSAGSGNANGGGDRATSVDISATKQNGSSDAASSSTLDSSPDSTGASNARASSADPRSLEAARRALSPGAQVVITAVTHQGGPGAVLDADHLKMAGLLVPADLTPAELREVVSQLRSSSPARTPEDALIAIDHAVRAVRNRNRTMTVAVDGGAPTALSPSVDTEDAGLTGEGPITSPSQVDGSAKQDDAFTIVHEAPPAVIGRWFRADGRDLVFNDEGTSWAATHAHQMVGSAHLLQVVPVISSQGEGRWDLLLQFRLQGPGQRLVRVEHRFMVERGEASSLGAQVGELAFEPYVTFVAGS